MIKKFFKSLLSFLVLFAPAYLIYTKGGLWGWVAIIYFFLPLEKLRKALFFLNDIDDNILSEKEQILKEVEGRYLNNEKKEEQNSFLKPNDGDEKTILRHMIYTKGSLEIDDPEGGWQRVFAQKHQLVEISAFYEDDEWYEEDEDEIDTFYLTGYEKGYSFDEKDICELYDIEEVGYYEWNGFSDDWCGIIDGDDIETCKKKWDDYKSKFPKISSKQQLEIEM